MKIAILLPYKENFYPDYPGAVSLFVNETSIKSKFKKNIIVFGNTNYKKKFKLKYKNIDLFNSNHASYDIAINTTPIGMYKEDCDNFFDIPIQDHTVLIDLIYTSKETLFLKKFDKCSKKINGLDMFIFQALKSIEIWRETNYNLDSQIESVRKQLENIKC